MAAFLFYIQGMDNQEIKTIQFTSLVGSALVKHGVVLRTGGYSKGMYQSLNLSSKCGDDITAVNRNRKLLAEWLGIESDKVLFPDQCHTANVSIVANHELPSLTETDAIITNQHKLAIGVLAADCVPVLFYDAVNGVIAAAHAGWKGTVQKIVPKVIELMAEKFNSKPEEIWVGIGPAIGAQRYEVGIEVHNAVAHCNPEAMAFCYQPSIKPGHGTLDLQALNRHQALASGIRKTQIETIGLCTYDNPHLFFSARRDGFSCGRFASVIMLI